MVRTFMSAACLVSRAATAFVFAPPSLLGRRHASASMFSASTSGPPRVVRGDGVGGEGVVITPAGDGTYDSVVIWLHGLGDTAMGWAPAMPSLGLERTKFVLPTAADRPISINGGAEMPGWFDLYGLDPSSPEDTLGFAEAEARVRSLIAHELAAEGGAPLHRIAVCGFSQGGAVALHVSLRYDPNDCANGKKEGSCTGDGRGLAACVALSAWLPFRSSYPTALSPLAAKLPILQCHGDEDMVVPHRWGEESNAALGKLLTSSGDKAQVTWRVYEGMGHSATEEELGHVAAFLRDKLGYSK